MAISLSEKTALCYNSALEKNARDLVALDLRGLSDVADVFIIATANSRPHAQTIVTFIEKALRASGDKKYCIEGYETAKWTLIDAGDVIIHVFLQETRDYYGLERVWADATPFDLTTEGERQVV